MTISPHGRHKFDLRKKPSDFSPSVRRKKYSFEDYINDVEVGKISYPWENLIMLLWIALLPLTPFLAVYYWSLYPFLLPVIFLFWLTIHLYNNYTK